jgi:alpha-tubulin suppressor-like RCC1 family protein
MKYAGSNPALAAGCARILALLTLTVGSVASSAAAEVRDAMLLGSTPPGPALHTTVAAGEGSSAEAGFTCMIAVGTEVWCWGSNTVGQLGVGDLGTVPRPSRRVVGLPPSIRSVTAGWTGACALDGAGAAWCWGAGMSGELGNGGPVQSSLVGIQVPLPEPALKVDAGRQRACALLASGAVYCWGSRSVLTFPAGFEIEPTYTPVLVELPAAAIDVAVGSVHGCALLAADGGTMCWGDNRYGQLAGGTAGGWSLEPTAVEGVPPLRAIHAGGMNSCGMTAAGDAYCWGAGQTLGGDDVDTFGPILVAGSHAWSTLALGGAGGCGIDTDGDVLCWGSGSTLGDGSLRARLVPVRVALPEPVIDIAVGNHACARLESMIVHCWGSNHSSALGLGVTPEPVLRPSPVAGAVDTIAMAVGARHACALRIDGTVSCWGRDDHGQLGSGDYMQRLQAGEAIVGDPPALFDHIAAGQDTSCAVNATGVLCWGRDVSGLMQGHPAPLPRTIEGFVGPPAGVAVSSAVGFPQHGCAWFDAAVAAPGAVQCWGDNSKLQLGRTTPEQHDPMPAPVEHVFDTPVTAVVTAAGATCALEMSGALICWGTTMPQSAPSVLFESGVTAVALAPGASRGCAIVAGEVLCWILDGSFAVSAAPMPAGETPVALAAGFGSLCATTASGRLYCWGANHYGQLGDGTTAAALAPRRVVDLPEDIAGVAPGDFNTCAWTHAGAAFCWGRNVHGQIGNGLAELHGRPVLVPEQPTAFFRSRFDP